MYIHIWLQHPKRNMTSMTNQDSIWEKRYRKNSSFVRFILVIFCRTCVDFLPSWDFQCICQGYWWVFKCRIDCGKRKRLQCLSELTIERGFVVTMDGMRGSSRDRGVEVVVHLLTHRLMHLWLLMMVRIVRRRAVMESYIKTGTRVASWRRGCHVRLINVIGIPANVDLLSRLIQRKRFHPQGQFFSVGRVRSFFVWFSISTSFEYRRQKYTQSVIRFF